MRSHDTLDNVGPAIVIPAHNESKFIGGLLTSILEYGPPNSQIIVVDNGSTDETPAIARGYSATVLELPSRISPALARNIGVTHASIEREILVFLDADVLLTPEWKCEWLKELPSLLHKKRQLTGASYDVSQQPGWIERNWFALLALRTPTSINGGNLITSRELFDLIGGFDPHLETGEDVDFCARAQRAGAALVINPGFRTHHEGNPKTIAAFVKRERWHGTGDLVNLRCAMTSKVILATCTFAGLHALMLGSAAYALLHGGHFSAPLASLGGIVALCLIGAQRLGGRGGLSARPQTIMIAYFYYFGRMLSIWDAIKPYFPRISEGISDQFSRSRAEPGHPRRRSASASIRRSVSASQDRKSFLSRR